MLVFIDLLVSPFGSLFERFFCAVACSSVCVFFGLVVSLFPKSLPFSFLSRVCIVVCRIQLAVLSRGSLRGLSAHVSYFGCSFSVDALRVSRAVTRLTVYRPHRVVQTSNLRIFRPAINFGRPVFGPSAVVRSSGRQVVESSRCRVISYSVHRIVRLSSLRSDRLFV